MSWINRDSEIKSIWLLFALMVVLFVALFLELMFAASSRAEGCLSIDVPPGAVTKVYDGDTFTVFTFGPGRGVDIRVEGIDTPERNKKQPRWEEARAFTVTWLSAGMFHVETCGKQTLTRIVGAVSRDGKLLSDALRHAGYAK